MAGRSATFLLAAVVLAAVVALADLAAEALVAAVRGEVGERGLKFRVESSELKVISRFTWLMSPARIWFVRGLGLPKR